MKDDYFLKEQATVTSENHYANDVVIRLLTPIEIDDVCGGAEHYQGPRSTHEQTGSGTYWQLPYTSYHQIARFESEAPEPRID